LNELTLQLCKLNKSSLDLQSLSRHDLNLYLALQSKIQTLTNFYLVAGIDLKNEPVLISNLIHLCKELNVKLSQEGTIREAAES